MGVGGSDVEQQAQYHPRGVSSALLFTNNAFWFPRVRCWAPQAVVLPALCGGRRSQALNAECQVVRPPPFFFARHGPWIDRGRLRASRSPWRRSSAQARFGALGAWPSATLVVFLGPPQLTWIDASPPLRSCRAGPASRPARGRNGLRQGTGECCNAGLTRGMASPRLTG